MRPPAKRRKNFRSRETAYATTTGFNEAACKEAEKPAFTRRKTWPSSCFNEAACKEAEKRPAPPWAGRFTGGFNEAACKEAEKRASTSTSTAALERDASMRPPAKRRKNLASTALVAGGLLPLQ